MILMKKILREITEFVRFFLMWFPGTLGIVLRRICYKRYFLKCGFRFVTAQGCYIRGLRNISIGNNVSFGPNAQIYAELTDKQLIIGDNVSANSNVMINANNGGCISIGANTLIGPNVVLRASNHVFAKKGIDINKQHHEAGTITIMEDVWLGANVVVVPNVVIGKGAVVGAGAVVTKDVAEYTIVAGVPALKIGMRDI